MEVSFDPITLVCMLFFAFLGGAIDSIVGGGGLIQFPALLILMPTYPIPTVMGTNKFAFIFGTATAAVRYSKHLKLRWNTLLFSSIPAGFAAYFGAQLLTYVEKETLERMVLVLLSVVAAWTFVRKDFGNEHRLKLSPSRELVYALILGCTLGFYDGFFGPGSGSFIIFILITIFGFSFLQATATTRAINCATNIGAVTYFGMNNHVLWKLGIALAIANSIGAYVGSKLAITKGTKFVRIVFMVIVSALIVKLGWMILNPA